MNSQEIKENGLFIKNHLIKNCSPNIVDDLIQETFVRILEDNQNKICISNIAQNVLYEQKRAEKMETRHLKQLFALYRSAISGVVSVDSLELKENLQILITAISELPPKSRQAIRLVYLEGMKAKEAATLIDCDFKAFRMRLDYGLKCLRKMIKIFQNT